MFEFSICYNSDSTSKLSPFSKIKLNKKNLSLKKTEVKGLQHLNSTLSRESMHDFYSFIKNDKVDLKLKFNIHIWYRQNKAKNINVLFKMNLK